MTSTGARAFVLALMPFGERFNDLYTLGIRAAVESAGAECERVDEQIFAEPIMQRVYEQIARADIVVAEVSEPNRNVFYEIGYAHALGKTTILLKREAADIPFDLKDYPHVIYGQSVSDLKTQLGARVERLLQNPRPPFSSAYFSRFFKDRLHDISPPSLLFLAVADHFTFSSTHGLEVERLEPRWSHDAIEWDRRCRDMEKLGLLDRNTSNEVRRTDLGTAIVFLALQAPEFGEVTGTMKSDEALVRKWGIS
jgi:hypothetical protein